MPLDNLKAISVIEQNIDIPGIVRAVYKIVSHILYMEKNVQVFMHCVRNLDYSRRICFPATCTVLSYRPQYFLMHFV